MLILNGPELLRLLLRIFRMVFLLLKPKILITLLRARVVEVEMEVILPVVEMRVVLLRFLSVLLRS